MDPLSFPAPNVLTAALESQLSDMLGKIYGACRANDQAEAGTPYVTWVSDLRARNFSLRVSPGTAPERLLRFDFVGYMNARKEVVGSRFRFDLADRSETYFIPGQIGFTGLQLYLSGNEFERVFPATTMPVAKEEWDLWGRGLTEEICRRYETVIYPRVLETLRKIGDRRGDHPLLVFDLGGGSGSLSEAVCQKVPCVRKIVLIEQSAVLLAEARRRASRHAGRFIAQHGDLADDDFLLREGLEQTPDVVVLSGVVAGQVLGRSLGLRVMEKCHQKLPSGGFALVPSYSPALLTSAEYEAMGFVVHNKTLNVIEERELRTNDFYILEKA